MAISRSALTEADIRKLVRGSTDDERAAAAHKLCRRIDHGLDEAEREAACQVLTLMAADAAELVRRALAVTLKASPKLPREIALQLAADVEAVATPVLRHSPVFTDEDLAEIVRLSSVAKQVAVAHRETLGEAVTTALAETGCQAALKLACANDNARFTEAALQTACDRFGDQEAVTTAIAFRKVLPLSVSERLVALVSEQVRSHLVDRHALTPETALEVALGARERATVDLVEQAGRTADLQAFVAHLHRQERLTASLLLRAAAHGHLAFVEWALAELSGVPHHRAWLMIHDAGPLGLRAVCERAGLAPSLLPAFRAAVDTFHALQAEGAARDRSRFQERMLERFLTQPQETAREEVDYLVQRLDALSLQMRGTGRPERPAARAAGG